LLSRAGRVVLSNYVGQRRADVARLALQAEPLEAATQPVGQPAVEFEIDHSAGGGLAFELLAGDRNGGAASGKLALAFGEEVGTAQVTDDLGEYGPNPARPCGVARMDDV